MKKLFTILVVILLFVLSILIFWASFAPASFQNFWSQYPIFSSFGNRLNLGNNLLVIPEVNNASEPVTSNSGQVTVGNNTWQVEIVRTEAEREAGLSNRQTLYHKKGMLFAFEKNTVQTFWMKDMLIPIDMIFFDENWKIVLIESDLQPNTFPKTFGQGVKSKFVLEINAGESQNFGLQVGDQASFSNK